MHAMWKPQKFKYIYLLATLYVFTLTIPSASAVYWAFGDELLNHANAFSLLPKNSWRDAAVILMLIHQVHINYAQFFSCMLACHSLCYINLISRTETDWIFAVFTVYHIWICVYATVLCVGEGNRHA